MTTAIRDGMPTWQDANQAHLAGALARIKDRLRRHAAGDASQAVDLPAEDGRLNLRPPALGLVVGAFGLSPFERDVLVLCAGIELDSSLGPLCAEAQGDPSRTFPTFSLALAALAGAHWSALSPGSPLRRWRLIEIGAGPSLTVSSLRIDERVLHQLVGVPHLDERLAGMIEPVEPVDRGDLAPSQRLVADRIASAWSALNRPGKGPVIQLSGPEPADRRAVAAVASSAVGLRLATLAADLIPSSASELEALVRLWEREAALGGLVLLVESDGLGVDPVADGPRSRALGRLIERVAGPLMISERERRAVEHRAALGFDVPRPSVSEQRAAWREALAADPDPTGVDAIADQFCLDLPTIRSTAAEAVARRSTDPGQSLASLAWDGCRARCRGRLDDRAQRIEPSSGWDDLVLPAPELEAIRRIAQHVRHRGTVHDAWGFASATARGLGISALFAGASGTGKTMAAEVLAGELGLDLYRIDLAGLFSKYIGETNKNLRNLFEAAERGGAILLFDEADAVFGKRSEVKDSHDRYANVEVSYLLQRIEAYRGLAILTTNLKGSLDPAFLRRIRFAVTFPFPDASQRAEIWRRAFPASTPTEGLDPAKLSRLNVAGGNIRNIALNAAFLAAEAGEPVRMKHISEAARIEYAKLERPLTDAEIGGWS